MNETKPKKKRICFIVNPVSGGTKKKNLDKLVNSIFDTEEFQVSINYTQSGGHAKQLTKEAVLHKSEIVVAVGGDGTINELASELTHSNSVLGIVPLGSGNGLARHLKIPLDTKKALELIKDGQTIAIDTALLNEERMVSIAGVGFDALVAKEFAQNKTRGFFTYFKLAGSKFFRYKSKKYKLRFADGSEKTFRAFFIAFANSNQFGYNTQISPNASVVDGKLDICIVKKPPLIKIPNIAKLMLRKRIDKSSFIKVIQSESVVVKRKKNKVINLDGEAVKISKNFTVKVDPLSLKIIVPNNG
jgi:YegS/Rv2252/BmrU family lipid kinase